MTLPDFRTRARFLTILLGVIWLAATLYAVALDDFWKVMGMALWVSGWCHVCTQLLPE